ncbi:hypothetical protein NE237_012377 [Protea cynaroides]|uniref:Uncharacterized protein n=1 Tax=Protea cynaroides TaxID=273540 RepID=A0A9Q0JWU5_9MAGN|nr:hypothetical protein NE237_012377 [Protea cynaroides]
MDLRWFLLASQCPPSSSTAPRAVAFKPATKCDMLSRIDAPKKKAPSSPAIVAGEIGVLSVIAYRNPVRNSLSTRRPAAWISIASIAISSCLHETLAIALESPGIV